MMNFPNALYRFKKRYALVCLVIFSFSSGQCFARSTTPPPMIQDRSIGADLARQVEEVNTLHRGNPALVDREVKKLLAQGMSKGGRYFSNSFPKGVFLDAAREDVQKVVKLFMRSNQRNWGGYLRELKFINELANPQSPFVLEEAGSRKLIKDGRLVEFDLLAVNKETGRKMVIESKEWKIRSTRDLEKAKNQISKIAKRAREEGVDRVTWVNRKRVLDSYRTDLLANAKKEGVGFYDDISTSKKLSHNLVDPRRFDDVLEMESKQLLKISGSKWISMSGKGFVLVVVAWETGNGLYSIHKFRSGRITQREFISVSSSAGGAIAGATAGAWAGGQTGAYIGTLFGPGGTAIGGGIGGAIGGISGAIAGGFAGEKAGNTAAERLIFSKLNKQEQQATFTALIRHYQQVAKQ